METKQPDFAAPVPLDTSFVESIQAGVLDWASIVRVAANRLDQAWRKRGEEPVESAGADEQIQFEFKCISKIPPEQQEAEIRRYEPPTYYSFKLSELFVKEARQALPCGIGDSKRWAQLALAIGRRGDSPKHILARAHALAYLANSRRIHADLDGAEFVMESAKQLLKDSGCITCHVFADILLLEASLQRDLGRDDKSADLLGRALVLGLANGDRQMVELCCLNLAITSRRRRRYLEAIQWLKFTGSLEGSLNYFVSRTAAVVWADLGEAEAARALLLPPPPELSELQLLRHSWAEGLIQAAAGDHSSARRTLNSVSGALARTGSLHEAAMAALDCARMLRSAGDWSALESESRKLVPIIAKIKSLDHAAADALNLFCEATCARTVTEDFIVRLWWYLNDVQRRKSFVFRPD